MLFLFGDRVSLCNPADLEFTIHLSQSLNCEDLQVRAIAFIWTFLTEKTPTSKNEVAVHIRHLLSFFLETKGI